MRIPVGLKIATLTLAATVFYMYVGQLVPQSEVHPPEEVELRADMTPEELVQVGRELSERKGMCFTCHTLGQTGALRFPDLAGIGARAGTRIPGMSDVEYLMESLYDPDAFIVPGYNPGMPAANRRPIGLTDQEIIAVVAYLQSLGGTVTVSLGEEAPSQNDEAPAPAETEAAPVSESPAPTDERALLQRFQCTACHDVDQPGTLEGPSLYDIGARMDERAIFSSVIRSEGGHESASHLRTATVDDLQRISRFLAQRRAP